MKTTMNRSRRWPTKTKAARVAALDARVRLLRACGKELRASLEKTIAFVAQLEQLAEDNLASAQACSPRDERPRRTRAADAGARGAATTAPIRCPPSTYRVAMTRRGRAAGLVRSAAARPRARVLESNLTLAQRAGEVDAEADLTDRSA